MVDLKVLEAMGSTQERLKEIFTAMPASPDERLAMTPEQQDRRDKNVEARQLFQKDIYQRFSQQLSYSLQNYQIYAAVDVAWDAAPINKATYPLLLYAQGKMDVNTCAAAVDGLPEAGKYTMKDDKGNITGINLPKFFEVNFNLVRSVLTRRLAAQANKYQSLYPYFKYEARSTSQVGKLRADALSQLMDIMVDQFGTRHHDVQVMRDSMLYAHCVDFVRAKWEEEKALVMDTEIDPALKVDGQNYFKEVIVKEGVDFVNPHPTRIGWDNAYPLSSINTDTGCEFILFWEIVRYGDVRKNPAYWNRDRITYSSTMASLFTSYAQYFKQYYCTLTPPCAPQGTGLGAANDRENNVGLYAQSMDDTAMVRAEYFRKIRPKDHGIGDYPHPVWMREVVAGDSTVIYAEFLPSTPAAYCGINENDNRQINISIAMELLPYQDQMSQLLSLLLLTIQSSNIRVILVDVDSATTEQILTFRQQAQAENRYNVCQVFEYSGIKMRDRGIDPKQIIQMVETAPSQAITVIFTAMAELVKLAERLMALSPQELGQPAPSGISATEVNQIGATTETMYGFISDAIDEFRAAKKRICYESYVQCGNQNVRVPVVNRYTKKTIAKAGFEVLDEDAETEINPDIPAYHTIIGTKKQLVYEYIFTSRDGALRAINTQSANVLTQLMAVLQNPVIMQAIGKEKLFNIVNEIFRLSGAGVDLNLELQEGESDAIGQDKQQQMEQILQQLTEHVVQNSQQIDALMQQSAQADQKFQAVIKSVQELTQLVQQGHAEPTAPPIDPLEFAKTKQAMDIERAEAAQRLAAGNQDMRHAEESHVVDTGLKLLQPMSGAA